MLDKNTNKKIDYIIVISLLYFIVKAHCAIVPVENYRSPTCTYMAGTDLPLCDDCDNPVPTLFFDFSLDNDLSDENDCGLTYLNPPNFHVSKRGILTSDAMREIYFARTGLEPVSNETSVRLSSFDTFGLHYTLEYDDEVIGQCYLRCFLNERISCSPYHTPFSVYSLPAGNVTINLMLTNVDNAACMCYLVDEIISVTGTDLDNNTCAYSSAINSIDPYVEGLVCFDETENTSKKRSVGGLVVSTLGQQTSGIPITCKVTSTDDEDFLLVTRDDVLNSTMIIFLDDYVLYQGNYITSVFTYLIPTDASDRGGVIKVLITYDDYTWSMCTSTLEGNDKCDNDDLSMFNSPWDCLSDSAKAFYVFFYLLCGSIVIFIIVIMTYVCIIIITHCIGCMMGVRHYRKWKISKSISKGIASGAALFMAEEAAAMKESTFRDVIFSYTTILVFCAVCSLCIASIILFIKMISNNRMSRAMKEVKGAANDLKLQYKKKVRQTPYGSYVSPFPVGFALLFLVCVSYCCNNNVLLESKSNFCTKNNDGTQSCTLDTTIQTTMKGVGQCLDLSSSDKNKPFGMKVTLISSGFLLRENIQYYTAFGICTFAQAQNCDLPDDDPTEQCQEFNSYGATCTVINDDSTGFPADSGSPYTRCQCQSFKNSQDDECNFVQSMNKRWAYSVVTTDGTVYKLSRVTSVIPFYVISVQITDASPSTFNCYITSYETYCSDNTVSITLVDVSNSNPLNTPLYLLDGGGSKYVAYQAQEVGVTNNCNLGFIQMSSGEKFSDGNAKWYEQQCNAACTDLGCSLFSCSTNMSDYATPLPTVVPGIGYISFINDTNSGFNGYVIKDSQVATSITIDIDLHNNFTFDVSTENVCPEVISIDSIVGCYDCSTPASFFITAISTCFEGVAYLSCNEVILNPTVFLNNTSNSYQFNYYADTQNQELSCTLTATTKTSFKVSGTLSEGTVNVQGPQQVLNSTESKSWINQFNNNKLNPESYFTFVILLIACIIFVCLCLGFLAAAGYCFIKCIL